MTKRALERFIKNEVRRLRESHDPSVDYAIDELADVMAKWLNDRVEFAGYQPGRGGSHEIRDIVISHAINAVNEVIAAGFKLS